MKKKIPFFVILSVLIAELSVAIALNYEALIFGSNPKKEATATSAVLFIIIHAIVFISDKIVPVKLKQVQLSLNIYIALSFLLCFLSYHYKYDVTLLSIVSILSVLPFYGLTGALPTKLCYPAAFIVQTAVVIVELIHFNKHKASEEKRIEK